MDLIKVILDEVREECYKCDGMGTRVVVESLHTPLPRVFCYECHGRGWKLTEMGQLLGETLGIALVGEYAAHDHTHTTR